MSNNIIYFDFIIYFLYVNTNTSGQDSDKMKLVIFDLDQTLVDVFPVHEEAFRRLFVRFFKTEASLYDTDFAGRSLTENFAAIARVRKVPDDVYQAQKDRLLPAFEEIFREVLPADARQNVLPGAVALLKALNERGNIVALYTGNSAAVGKAILTVTGLKGYFKFCLFGTDVKVRSEMISLAIEKAHSLTGRLFPGKDVVVFGDSFRDVQAGQSAGALTVALGTGFYTEAQLRGYKPDCYFKDLSDTGAVLAAIG
jgi:phosphoglycolate phosphatase-like HAD superfamily hydrolase